VTQDSCFW